MNAAIRSLAGRLRRIPVTRDSHEVFVEGMSFGERLADRVAAIGGSWSFILGFSVFLGAWVVLNTVILAASAFDPFPFIFLNLMLSMLAALQAPIIMMSQNRQAAKDRLEARLDYETNTRAEAQILALSDELAAMREDMRLLMAAVGASPEALPVERRLQA